MCHKISLLLVKRLVKGEGAKQDCVIPTPGEESVTKLKGHPHQGSQAELKPRPSCIVPGPSAHRQVEEYIQASINNHRYLYAEHYAREFIHLKV